MATMHVYSSRCLAALVITVSLTAFIVPGCGGGRQAGIDNVPAAIAGGGMPEGSPNGRPGRTLAQEIGSIQAVSVPAGVDAELWNELRSELIRQLCTRSVSALDPGPPAGLDNTVSDLAIDETDRLTWSYQNIGDYDLNSEVNISDITPIALFFKVTRGSEDWPQARCVDGDGNGEINLSDITPIATHYLATVDKYCVYASSEEDDFPQNHTGDNGAGATMVGEVVFDLKSEVPGGLEFSFQVADFESGGWLWVRPVFGQDALGTTSDLIQGMTAPAITEVTPPGVLLDQATQLNVAFSGTEPVQYLWNFDTGLTPDTSTDAQPTVLGDTEGDYTCRVVVGNDAGMDTHYFTLFAEPELQVLSVSPLTGVPGAETSFTIEVEGPSTYVCHWNFGDALNPSIMTCLTPVGTLSSQEGEYQATVTVESAFQSVDFPFTLVIEKPQLEVTEVLPTEADAEAVVTFTAQVIPPGLHSYSWDFGGGATPNTSTDESPTVTIGAIGEYDANVQVSDGVENVDFPFTLTATDPIADTLLIYKDAEEVVVGEPVTLTVFTGTLSNPFRYLNNIGITIETDSRYVFGSFDIGEVDAIPDNSIIPPDPYPNVVDGIWEAVGATTFIQTPDEFIACTTIGGGRERWDLKVMPTDGSDLANGFGALLNFQLEFSIPGEKLIGIQEFQGVNRTYYMDSGSSEYTWGTVMADESGTLQVAGMDNSITVTSWEQAPDITGVSPTSGTPGAEVTFIPQVSPVPVNTWLWDFGGGASPNNPPVAEPTVTLGVIGDYSCSLTATNDFGSDVFPFTLSVMDLSDDVIFALPDKHMVVVGEPVSITVSTGIPANAFKYLNGVAITFEDDAEYVADTFNVGVPGGARNGVDGIWTAINPMDFLLPSEGMIQGQTIPNSRERWPLNITPIGGTEITGTAGILLNLQFTFNTPGTKRIGLQQFDGIKWTYYSDEAANEHYWGTLMADQDGNLNVAGVDNTIEVLIGP